MVVVSEATLHSETLPKRNYVTGIYLIWYIPCDLVKRSFPTCQNPPCTVDKIREPVQIQMLSQLDLESKGQGHSKIQKPMPKGAKNMSPKKN